MKVATIVKFCGYQLPNKTQLARDMHMCLRLFKIIVTLERNNNKHKKTIITCKTNIMYTSLR